MPKPLRKNTDPPKKGGKPHVNNNNSEGIEDSRFSSVLSAPIFKNIPAEKNKVVLDERFKHVLTDEKFRVLPGGGVDQYGRKVKRKSAEAQAVKELESFYTIDQSSLSKETHKGKSQSGKPTFQSDEDRLDYLNRLARGEISDGEDSDDSDEDDDEDAQMEVDEDEEDDESDSEEEEDEFLGKSPLDIPGDEEVEYGDATRRISILNCDWENIKSNDLMVILQSFCPPGKNVLNVTIYPSDFGKEQMAIEEKYGPQGIWKKESDAMKKEAEERALNRGSDEEDEDEEDEDEEEESEDEEEDDEDDNSDNDNNEKSFQKKTPMPPSDDSKKKKKKKTDFDDVALRQYELSKLRYYFAIAECDSIETANVLYEQLDDVELGETGMAMELRFVPDDLDLSSREVRDSCNATPHSYKPPEFVVNALQHTNVECTWDTGEKEREKKLTNISAWRSLKESELMQYVASSDSEDYESDENEEEDDDSEEEEESGSEDEPAPVRKGGKASSSSVNGGSVGGGSVKSLKKKKKAKNLRKLLLGDDEEDEDDDDDEEDGDDNSRNNIEQDDFFNHDEDDDDEQNSDSDEDDQKHKKKSKKNEKSNSKKKSQKQKQGVDDNGFPQPDENGEITFSYIPEADLKETKDSKLEGLTPYEMDLKKAADKRKERKAQRKVIVQEREEEKKEKLMEAKEKLRKEKKHRVLDEDDQEFNDQDRLVSSLKPWELQRKQSNDKKLKKLEKKQQKLDKKNEKKDRAGEFSSGVDITDERFRRVFEGSDANFGIDRTANEFKETKGMQKILEEQKKRRNNDGSSQRISSSSSNHNQKNMSLGDNGNPADDKGEINNLVNKLKRKFAAVN